jgi:acyl dehydratase
MNYSDLEAGDEVPPVTIKEIRGEEMKLVTALLQDPYRVHFDPKAAEEHGYPDLLNQGPVNLSFMLQPVLQACESPADLLEFQTRYESMVFAGDTVTATATVTDKRVEGGDALMEFELALTKTDGERTVSGTATVRFDPPNTEPE